jgi:AraC-like DNA-binding protein
MLDRINDIIHAAVMVFCLISSLYFLCQKCDEQAPIRLRHLMGTILMIIAFQSSLFFFGTFTGIDYLIVDKKMSVLVNLQVLPFCLMMLTELTRMSEVTTKKWSIHVGVTFAILLIYIVLTFVNQQYADVFYYMSMAELLIYIGVYVVRFAKAAKRYNKTVADVYADLDGRSINWLNRILILMLVFALGFVLLKIVMDGFYDNRIAGLAFYLITLVICVVLSWNVDQMRMIESIPYGDEQRAVLEESSSNEDEEEEEATEHVEGRELTAEQKEFMEQLDTVCTEGNLYSMHGITREDVAKAMMTNHIRLTKLLKEATGLTFNAYITKIRLDQAARMLLETNDTIEQIYYTCGYRTRSTFNRAFTDAFGCTPKEYRRKAEH